MTQEMAQIMIMFQMTIIAPMMIIFQMKTMHMAQMMIIAQAQVQLSWS